MIDIHFHCLPGIDDGPEGFEEAVALCRQAADEGTTHIVATPHVLRDRWINDDVAARDRLVLELNHALSGRPAILPGCEYYFSLDALDLLEQGAAGVVTPLARGHHVLVEFPSQFVPRGADEIVHEMHVMGLVPVIAHPERNVELATDLDRLARLVELGAKTQITAAAVAGDLSPWVSQAVDAMLARDLVHFVASDAHNLDRRPPRLAAARAVAEARWGAALTRRVFDENPLAVVERLKG